MEKNDVKKTLV